MAAPVATTHEGTSFVLATIDNVIKASQASTDKIGGACEGGHFVLAILYWACPPGVLAQDKNCSYDEPCLAKMQLGLYT